MLLASSVGLGAFCLAADYVVFKLNKTWKEIPHGKLIKASLDNIAHALVGGWSWLNLVLLMEEPWSAVRGVQVVCCTAMASLIDLDHFISAGSLSFTVSQLKSSYSFNITVQTEYLSLPLTLSHTSTHTCMHAHAHVCTHTHTHTHARTHIQRSLHYLSAHFM